MARAKAKADQKAGNGRGSIDPLPSGKYRWRITVGLKPDGTPIRKTGTAPSEKEAWAAMTQAQADHMRGGVAAPDRVTLGEWLDRWLASKRPSLAAKTHHNYRKLIDLHITPALGRKRLQDVRPADLRGLYTGLGAAGLGDSMQRQAHNVLHGAFSEALRLELVMRDPTAVVRPQPVKRDATAAPVDKALTAEEVAALLPALRASRWGLVFEFMLHTGLRRGEACGLKWEHVDLNAGTVQIRENLVTIGSKAHVSTPKTAKSARRVHLSPEALDCLNRQKAVQDFERAALAPGQRVPGHPKTYVRKRGWEDTGYVFTGITGRALPPAGLRRYLAAFCTEAGVREVTVHGLRHTHASLMLRRGVPLEVVSEKLGHSRPSFTADVYRTVYQSEHEEWAVNLSDLVRPRVMN
ncbi:site-specific integrase [Deinococcus seoulensis]|uniref:Site-specific integrase n=1 Tax=Deinococcus seoulensis TaxID=1837379 RepID=A0ABQ2RM23_9DEIO|nr:tyrosine-type recombinase/integrase [Deinococcus seoulensis]GGR48718.1 site-specific integrase [Deinococcus seoulensis]